MTPTASPEPVAEPILDALLAQDVATAIAVLDHEGVARRWNPLALRIWGPATGPYGLAALAAPALAIAAAQVATHAKRVVEVDLGRGGTARITDADGALLLTMTPGAMVDAEREHLMRWQLALDCFDDGVWDWDIQSNRVHYSRNWKAMLGYAEHEIGDQPEEWRSRLHPDDRDAVELQVARHLREGADSFGAEFRMRHKDGDWRWIHSRGRIVAWSGHGRPLRAVGTHVDITARKLAAESLIAASNYQSQLFDVLPANACVLDADGSITHVNQAWVAYCDCNGGTPARSMVGVNYLAVCDSTCDGDDAIAHSAAAGIRAVIAGQRERFHLLYPCHSPDEQHWYELRVAPLPGPAPRAVVIGHLDVTRLQEIQAQVHLLEHAVSSANDGVLISDATIPDQPVVFVNEAFERITGYSRAEAMGRNCRFLQNQDSDQPALHDLRAALAGVRPVRVLLRNYRKSGELFWNSLSIAPVFRADGVCTHHIGIISDVSERVRTTERIERIAAHVPGMIYQYHVGPDGSAGFPYSSDGIRSLFGVTPEAARTDASRVLAAVHPDDFVQVRDSILRSSATLTPWRREFRVRLPDGQTIWAEGNSTPVVASDGSVSWYGYAADITARKLAEQALKRALEDLQHRNRDLQDFASIASHDLQEPLRKIRMFGDRLAGSIVGLHSEQHDQLTRMVGAAERMSILIDDLLAYSRAGIANDDGGPVDLGELVAEVLVDLEGRTAESDARIEIGPLPRVDGDRVQLRQVLQNLLANALKFRMPGRQPLIRVTGERVAAAAFEPGVAAWARIRVSDNGIGFPPDKAESLFAPFRRLHSRAEYEGTGIGLAIVRRIVERHGGHITAIGRPGGGAEFVVDLPLRE